jgi:hypothetical protein
MDCTVLAFDYPSEFSLITGILAGMGFNILSVMFYLRRVPRKILEFSREAFEERGKPSKAEGKPSEEAERIRFSEAAPDYRPFYREHRIAFSAEVDSRAEEKMASVIGLLEQGDEPSVVQARHRVNEMVVSRLFHFQKQGRTGFYPVEMEVDNTKGLSRLKVVSEDTPAFSMLCPMPDAQAVIHRGREIRTIRGRIEYGRRWITGERRSRIPSFSVNSSFLCCSQNSLPIFLEKPLIPSALFPVLSSSPERF